MSKKIFITGIADRPQEVKLATCSADKAMF
jgi:hypothetical protein